MPLELTITQLGFVAGLIVTLSNLPDFIGTLWTRELAPNYKVVRDAICGAGNLIWARFGQLSDAQPIMIFCSLSALMLFTLVGMQLWLRLRLFLKSSKT